MKNMCWTVTFNWARGWRNGCEHAVSLKLADRSNKIKISFLIQSIVGSSELAPWNICQRHLCILPALHRCKREHLLRSRLLAQRAT